MSFLTWFRKETSPEFVPFVPKFAPGDLCEFLGAPPQNIYLRPGVKPPNFVTIIAFIGIWPSASEPGYSTVDRGGEYFNIVETCLRKVPPDDSRRVTCWEDCVWQPNLVSA